MVDSSASLAHVAGTAHVFGHDDTDVRLELMARSTRWRAGHAARYLVGGTLLAPIVAAIPPHVPWAAGAGFGGLFLAARKWRERFTLVGVEGRCPRCGTALGLSNAAPLKDPHSVFCANCKNPVVLRRLQEPGSAAPATRTR